jgi:hypothetical protein
MGNGQEPAVWMVAGCLFEVSLAEGERGPWVWSNRGPEVTLLAESVRDGERRFRFRSEAAGADAGAVELRFACEELERTVLVRIARETGPG